MLPIHFNFSNGKSNSCCSLIMCSSNWWMDASSIQSHGHGQLHVRGEQCHTFRSRMRRVKRNRNTNKLNLLSFSFVSDGNMSVCQSDGEVNQLVNYFVSQSSCRWMMGELVSEVSNLSVREWVARDCLSIKHFSCCPRCDCEWNGDPYQLMVSVREFIVWLWLMAITFFRVC